MGAGKANSFEFKGYIFTLQQKQFITAVSKLVRIKIFTTV